MTVPEGFARLNPARFALLFVLLARIAAAPAAEQPPAAGASVYPMVTGASHYVENCAVCHGTEARGDGPLAPGLTTAPTNLRRLAIVNGGEFPTARVRESIDGRNLPRSHGIREMPVWGSEFKRTQGAYGERRVQERLDILVDYLKSLQDTRP